ncbi:MAG: hypothetical protein KDD44_13210, partial [Bdellovibrionales bacterium]|nr:hypothetical protein [Bdellovibrionales bacterium]
MRCVEQINQTLYRLLAEDERVLLLGEDILDPYGGAFKATKGLSTAFPDRVLATPISEATIVGVAGGLALEGFRPVVELMFGDFLGLTFDQLLNYVTKYALMFQGGVQCPLVVRTPMGGRRGYGPTHSQSIEKHFVGIPGLEVLALSQVHPIDAMLRYAVLESDGPTLLIENKRLYGAAILPTGRGKIGEHIVVEDGLEDPRGSVVLSLAPEEVPDITIVTYGDSLNEVMQASETLLIEEELVSEIVVLGSLSPLLLDATIRSLRRSGRL